MIRGKRLPRGRYVGTCTATQHLAILRSGQGTYCAWHRQRALWRALLRGRGT